MATKNLMSLISKSILLISVLFLTLADNLSLGQDMKYKPGVQRTIREAEMTLPFTSIPQNLTVEVVEGVVVIGGDMVLGPESILSSPQPDARGRGGAAIVDHRWAQNTIPYTIVSGHPAADTIRAALEQLSSSTNLRFVQRTDQADYVEYFEENGCWSYVGRQGGKQRISIGDGCGHKYIVMHETLHAAGLFHEQSRQDRDSYVVINTGNIIQAERHNFDKYTTNYSGNDIGTYDFISIMHYGPYAFTSNSNPTIEPTAASRSRGRTVQVNERLSAGDIAAVNHIYPAATASTESLSFDVTYDNEVELVPQTTALSCWAASAAMMVGWNDCVSINPEEIARGAGYWANYVQGNTLPPDDIDMLNHWGLVAEPPMTFTVRSWRDMLHTYGPLWVAARINGTPHVVVITGISGDGTPGGTLFQINDPLERDMPPFRQGNRGSRYTMTCSEFTIRQSDLASEELNFFEIPVYVAHF